MKPRTNREKEVVRLSEKLPPLTETQKEYAFEHCFKHKAAIKSRKQHTYYCLECGSVFTSSSNLADDIFGVDCPHCHSHLSTDGHKRITTDVSSFQIITTTCGYQVIRTFYTTKVTQHKKACKLSIHECIRRFMKPGYSDIVLALSRKPMSYYYHDSFDFDSDMTIKKDNEYYHDVWADVVYPRQFILPTLKRNGYCDWLKKNTQFSSTFHKLMEKPRYETIAKVGRFDLWKMSEEFINANWEQVKMAMRHNYHPEDIEVWKDVIRMAKELGYAHSVKHVIPQDLFRTHDKLVIKHNKGQREKDIEEHRKYEQDFKNKFSKWLGICITSGDITIRPLQNYSEYYDEGKAMHHCVATYFSRSENLILTARAGEKRLATIELDMKNFTIVQCRSYCNKKPEQYDAICGAINDNISLFKQPKNGFPTTPNTRANQLL